MPLAFFNHSSHVAIRHIYEEGRVEKIPAHVYRVRISKEGIDLQKDRKRYKIPSVIFGKHHEYRNTIIEEFNARDGSTGVILHGLKGSGKSLLAEDICNAQISQDVPVLMIDHAIPAEALRSVIKLINGPVCVHIDEFGKLYSENERASMLTLFSDTSLKKVMFIVTSNKKDELNKYMLDRPGRFMFRIKYDQIDLSVIREVVNHHGFNDEISEAMVGYCMVRKLSFDMINFIAGIAKKVRTAHELMRRIEILNVPSPVYRTYQIQGLTHQGKPFYGEVCLTPNENGFDLDLFDESVDDVAMAIPYTYPVEMVSANKRTVSDPNTASVHYQIKLSEDSVVHLSVLWGDLTFGKHTRTFKSPELKAREQAAVAAANEEERLKREAAREAAEVPGPTSILDQAHLSSRMASSLGFDPSSVLGRYAHEQYLKTKRYEPANPGDTNSLETPPQE